MGKLFSCASFHKRKAYKRNFCEVNELQVILNGNLELVEKPIKLSRFLQDKGLDNTAIIVEYNGDIIKEQTWGSVVLKDNDRLEILKFVGGG